MNAYSLPAIIAFTINVSLAFLVLLDNPRQAINRWFCAFILLFALWNLSEILILNSSGYRNAVLGAQVLYRAIFLIPALFLIISYLFPAPRGAFASKPVFQIGILGVAVAVLVLSFPDFLVTVHPLPNMPSILYYEFRVRWSAPFLLSLAVAIGFFIWGTANLVHKLQYARTNREKNQIRFLLFGVVSIFLTFLFINALRRQLDQLISFYVLSTALSLLVSFFFVAAILRFRLVRLSHLISGGITYSFLSSIVLAFYFFVVRSLEESLVQIAGIRSFLVEALLILLLIMLIRPLEGRMRRTIDRLLYRDIYAYRRRFLSFTREMMSYHDRKTFFRKISHFLRNVLQIQKVLVFLRDDEQESYDLFQGARKKLSLGPDDPLVAELKRQKGPVEFYDLDHSRLRPEVLEFLKMHGIAVLVPLIHESDLLAFLALSGRKRQKGFRQEELEILGIFANEMAITLMRNRSVEQIQQEERERGRMERLAAIGQLTAGVAHEIRNPLNTIVTSAETLLRRKLDREAEEELKSYILEEAQRLDKILTDFLNLSKIRSPEVREVNLDGFLERIEYGVQVRLPENVEFSVEKEAHESVLATDPDLLEQVLINLLNNGIEAIEEAQSRQADFKGKLLLRVTERKHCWWWEVEDNGVGIPPEKQNEIFNPFFTTKPTGTGLGLSISLNIVQTLGGKIEVESEEGWTTFRVVLPKLNRKEKP
ncbi:MAG TPA: GAF domain-containing protein [Bacteroidetes bacterium]|nr:GAF domain-containing protein [Bacteroidota bacterium]